MTAPTIDLHMHLAGFGAGGSGCFVSQRMRSTLVYKVLLRWVKIDPDDPGADDAFAAKLARLIRDSEHVDAGVAFGMDGVYDGGGKLLRDRSHLYVPNEHVFDVCSRHPELLPGPSVNPLRADAMDELARCDERGAVLIKWLPPLQHFDPADPRVDSFYEELARRGIPLLAHTGCEHTFPDVAHEFGHAARYRKALQAGATVIFAHCGVACRFHRDHHQTPEVLRMLAEFPGLYSDTSALASLLKFQHLKSIPFEDFPGRFVHGSDYPIPPLAFPFALDLGLSEAMRLTFGGNPVEADWRIKEAIGMPAEVFTNGAAVLGARLARWRELRPVGRP